MLIILCFWEKNKKHIFEESYVDRMHDIGSQYVEQGSEIGSDVSVQEKNPTQN